jgi:hypothetical protein
MVDNECSVEEEPQEKIALNLAAMEFFRDFDLFSVFDLDLRDCALRDLLLPIDHLLLVVLVVLVLVPVCDIDDMV